MNTSLKPLGKVSFTHYGCIISASLFTNDPDKPEILVAEPDDYLDELGKEIIFKKVDNSWLVDYSLPVLHSDTYKDLVETIIDYLEK